MCTTRRSRIRAAGRCRDRAARGSALDAGRTVASRIVVAPRARRARRRGGTIAPYGRRTDVSARSPRSRRTPAGRRSASWLITRRISLVAVCCSSASVSSRFRACSSVEQAHVLDGDDGLVGEGLQQLDLLVGEQARTRSVRRQIDAHRPRRPAAWARRDAPVSRRPARVLRASYSGSLSTSWMCIDRRRRGSTARRDGACASSRHRVHACGRSRRLRATVRDRGQLDAASPSNARTPRPSALAELAPRSQRSSRRPAGGRSASSDHPQDLAGRRLLLERLVSSRFRASSSLNSRTFSMAITAWSAKVFSSCDLLVGERPGLGARRR